MRRHQVSSVTSSNYKCIADHQLDPAFGRRPVAKLTRGPKQRRKEGRTPHPEPDPPARGAGGSSQRGAVRLDALDGTAPERGPRDALGRRRLGRARARGAPPAPPGGRRPGDRRDQDRKESRRSIALAAPLSATLRTHRARQDAERLALGAAWVDSDYVVTTSLGTPIDPRNATGASKGLSGRRARALAPLQAPPLRCQLDTRSGRQAAGRERGVGALLDPHDRRCLRPRARLRPTGRRRCHGYGPLGSDERSPPDPRALIGPVGPGALLRAHARRNPRGPLGPQGACRP